MSDTTSSSKSSVLVIQPGDEPAAYMVVNGSPYEVEMTEEMLALDPGEYDPETLKPIKTLAKPAAET